MKVVFLAPVVKERANLDYYRLIVESVERRGHTVVDMAGSFKVEDITKRSRRMIAAIQDSPHAVIVEATTINPEISVLISRALQYHVPTLLLYRDNNPDVMVFEPNRFLTLKKYTQKSLEDRIEMFLRRIKKDRLIYRFNLMLNRELGAYVMDQSKKRRVSKADYIRSLILSDMDDSSM